LDAVVPLKRFDIQYRSIRATRSNADAWSLGLSPGFFIPTFNVRLYASASSVIIDNGEDPAGGRRFHALGNGVYLERISQKLVKVEYRGANTVVRSIPNGPELTFAPAFSGGSPILKGVKLASGYTIYITRDESEKIQTLQWNGDRATFHYADGRLTQIGYDSGTVYTFAYNGNRLSEVFDSQSTVPLFSFSYSDATTPLISVLKEDGDSPMSMRYDQNGWLTSLRRSDNGVAFYTVDWVWGTDSVSVKSRNRGYSYDSLYSYGPLGVTAIENTIASASGPLRNTIERTPEGNVGRKLY
jgi:YD repeat-containing protein